MRHYILTCLAREKTTGMTENVDKAIFAFKQFFKQSNPEL